ncbi:Phosphatidylinositol 4-phosphate 5-kinase 8 [Diplonema papillatum]|nr:Phosphatidylinositol 4-phosphate 5-kinase 8 [Diplonema papillatum]
MLPEPDWGSVAQGPPQPPPNIYSVLEPPGQTSTVDIEMMKLAMASYSGSISRTDGLAADGTGEGVEQFDGTGTGAYTIGYTYSGWYKNCLANGSGRFAWEDGMTYTGDVENHGIDGSGLYVYPNGDTYDGEVQAGIRHGKGSFVRAATKETYTGDWTDSVFSGKGRMQYSSSSYYDGDWDNGARTGFGTMVYPSGSKYVGEWLDDKKDGRGVMVWVDPATQRPVQKYDGDWKDGQIDGSGTYWYYASAATPTDPPMPPLADIDPKQYGLALQQRANHYTGGFKKGKRHGRGVFCYRDGSRYEGRWEDNQKHGEGTFLYETGAVYTGSFSRDEPTGKMQLPTKASLTRFVPLQVDDLLIGEADKDRVLDRVHCLLSRHYWSLRRLYQHYTSIHTDHEQRSGDALSALSMLQFWRLVKDTHLINSDLSLAAVDRIFLTFQQPGPAGSASRLVYSKPPVKLDPLPSRLREGSAGLSIAFVDKSADVISIAGSRAAGAGGGGGPAETEPKTHSGRSHAGYSDRRKSKASDGRSVANTSRRVSMQRKASVNTTPKSRGGGSIRHSHSGGLSRHSSQSMVLRDIHSSTTYMYFRDFTEAIVRIAALKYANFPSLTLADKLAVVLQSDLKPSSQETSFLKESSRLSSVLSASKDLLWSLYQQYSTRTFKGLATQRTRPAHDVVITVRQFLTMLRDLALLGRGAGALSTQSVLALFDTPLILNVTPSIENLDAGQELSPFPPKFAKKQRPSGRDSATESVFLSSADVDDVDHLSLRSRSPTSTMRGDESRPSQLDRPTPGDILNEALESRRKQRKVKLEKLTRGKNDFKVHCSLTVDQELLYEEFVEAVVRVSIMLRRDSHQSNATAVQNFIQQHLSKLSNGAELA